MNFQALVRQQKCRNLFSSKWASTGKYGAVLEIPIDRLDLDSNSGSKQGPDSALHLPMNSAGNQGSSLQLNPEPVVQQHHQILVKYLNEALKWNH